jgi:2',3'-cyclic-nucleotide 2'-phosphodiesterase (5'-nucleotidase family)
MLGFSAPASSTTLTDLTMVTTFPPIKSLEILHFSDFHGAIDVSSSSIGAATLTSVFASDRLKNPATFTLSSGDNIGAAPPLSR